MKRQMILTTLVLILTAATVITANCEERHLYRIYLDELESYSTNEVAINWNAPLSWVAAAIEEYKAGVIPDREGSSTPMWPLFVGIGLLAIAGFVIGWRLRKNASTSEE